MLIDPIACPDLTALTRRWPAPRRCCTRRRRICRAWRRSGTGPRPGVRHRARRAAARIPPGCARHHARRGARLPARQGSSGRRLVGPAAVVRRCSGTRRLTWSGRGPPGHAGGAARRAGKDGVGQAGVRRQGGGAAPAAPGGPVAAHLRHPQGAQQARLAIVRELWEARDEIARAADTSPRRVLTDQAIVEAARARQGFPPPVSWPSSKRSAGSARGAPAGTRRAGWPRCARSSSPTVSCPRSHGASGPAGPPPAHRWSERDPAAAARLTAAREAVPAVAPSTGCPRRTCSCPRRSAGSPGSRRSRPSPRRSRRRAGRTAPGPGRWS